MAPGFLGANQCEPGGAAALGSTYGGAGERSEPERAQAVANLGKCTVIAARYPLSHDHHPPSNRVTPNGVGQLPESQTRHSQRVQPAPLSHDTFSVFAAAYALSVTAAPCQLSHRESQGAGVARPAHRNHRIVKSAAQRVRRRESGGAAALGSPYGGAGERTRA